MEESSRVYWLEKGTVLAGKYRIEDVIGEGGFGIVYLGSDLVLNIKVAIKEYFPRKFAIRESGTSNLYIYKRGAGHASDGTAEMEDTFQKGLQKFYNEARVQAQFYGVEGIATVRDFFYENRTAYIINDYIPGVNVRTEVSKNGRMRQERVLKLMRPILDSLEAVHKNGLLHRDISPDNIILQGDRAVLIDFGAARMANVQDDRSMTVLFKRGYSAEEQYIRNGRQGAYMDVYAVCATMYYMLTGIEPEEAVSRRIKDRVVPLKKYREIEIDARVRKAVMKGMSVAVSKRYGSIAALCDALYGKKKHPGRLLAGVGAAGLAAVLCLVAAAPGIGPFQGTGHRGNPVDAEEIGADDVSSGHGAFDGIVASQGNDLPVSAQDEASAEPPEVYRMPDVSGLSREAAKERIKNNSPGGMKICIKRVYHAKAARGKVVGQNPKAGRKYRDGEVEKVVLRISKGKKPSSGQTPDKGEKASDQGKQALPVQGQAERTSPPAAGTGSSAAPDTGNSGTGNGSQKKNSGGSFAGSLPW